MLNIFITFLLAQVTIAHPISETGAVNGQHETLSRRKVTWSQAYQYVKTKAKEFREELAPLAKIIVPLLVEHEQAVGKTASTVAKAIHKHGVLYNPSEINTQQPNNYQQGMNAYSNPSADDFGDDFAPTSRGSPSRQQSFNSNEFKAKQPNNYQQGMNAYSNPSADDFGDDFAPTSRGSPRRQQSSNPYGSY